MPGKRKAERRTKNAILTLFNEEQGNIEFCDILKRLEEQGFSIKKGTLGKHLHDLENGGEISRPYRGVYHIEEKGKEALNKSKFRGKIYKLGKKATHPHILSIYASYNSVPPQEIFSEMKYGEKPYEELNSIDELEKKGYGYFYFVAEDHWYVNQFYPPGITLIIIIKKDISEIHFLCGLIGPDKEGFIDKIIEGDCPEASYRMLICEISHHLYLIDAVLKKNGSELWIEEVNLGELIAQNVEIKKRRKVKKSWKDYKKELIKLSGFREIKKQP